MNFEYAESNNIKAVKSENYNFTFDKRTGLFHRWGKGFADDPTYSPIGPEIADIEISTICRGVEGVGVCKFCYKGNTPKGRNMSLETFQKLFHRLPRHLTQIAFGIGDIDSNSDMWDIFEYSRAHGVIPNVTVNGEGIDVSISQRLASVCGAVAVSLYDKDKTYNAVELLTDAGMTQVNIHYMLSEQTFARAKELLNDRLTDPRLQKLNAIVFLALKPKGRASFGRYTSLPQDKYKELVEFALENNIGIGFDSCSAFKFLDSVKHSKNYKVYEALSEPCEATLFSSYFNVDGSFFPCSFIEGTPGWEEGINIIDKPGASFNDIWYAKETQLFREKTLVCRTCKKACAVYKI